MSRSVMRILAGLPLSLLHALGACLGWVMYGLSPTYRRHLRDNLQAAGYGGDPQTRRAAIASAGRLLMELPYVWLRPRAELTKRVRIEGLEHVEAARAAGDGIVFLTPHLGCFELAAQVAAERFPITVLYRAPKLGWLQSIMEEGRGRENVQLAPADLTGVRLLLRALKERGVVGILPDQVPGNGEGEWVDFFGKPAYTMTLAARLVDRAGTACLLAFVERLPGGAGYVLHVRPMPPAEAGESALRHLNRALEELIRLCPGQYLWGYNRYKRPRNAEAPERA